jgi:hypothetical protein
LKFSHESWSALNNLFSDSTNLGVPALFARIRECDWEAPDDGETLYHSLHHNVGGNIGDVEVAGSEQLVAHDVATGGTDELTTATIAAAALATATAMATATATTVERFATSEVTTAAVYVDQISTNNVDTTASSIATATSISAVATRGSSIVAVAPSTSVPPPPAVVEAILAYACLESNSYSMPLNPRLLCIIRRELKAAISDYNNACRYRNCERSQFAMTNSLPTSAAMAKDGDDSEEGGNADKRGKNSSGSNASTIVGNDGNINLICF